jgi:predicted amidohydrolase
MRVAAVQCFALSDDFERASNFIAERLGWADREGVDLVLFPEAYVLGHSYDGETIRRRAEHVSAHLN